jgi:hypothetical protein
MIVRIGSDKSMRLCYVDRTKRARKITDQRGVEVESVEEWMVFLGEESFAARRDLWWIECVIATCSRLHFEMEDGNEYTRGRERSVESFCEGNMFPTDVR